MTQLLAATRPSLSIAGRVAYVVNHSFPHSSNGYAVRTHGVAAALAANGHSVIVINRPGRPWDIASAKVARADIVFQQDGVQYLCLPKPSQHNYPSQPQWAEAAADALEQAFRVYKPAVVVAASNWENAEPAMLAAKRLKLPFYYEVRGFWELSRASSDPSWQGSDEYKHAVDKETAIACAADKVITLNPLMQQQLVKRGVAADKIIILPNGVNALPQPGKPAKPGAALRVGYIGSFSAYEGLDDLLQAVALLRQSGLALSLNLVGSGNQSGIISSSDSRAAQQLQTKAEQLGIAQWVSINPRVANGAIAEYYQGVDLIVNPRRSYPVTELVSSLKPIEAAAYAKPVLLSDVAPNKQLAEQCSAFTLFNSGDVIDLAAKLKALLTNAALYQRCAEQGASWVAQQRLFATLVKPLSQLLYDHSQRNKQFRLGQSQPLALISSAPVVTDKAAANSATIKAVPAQPQPAATAPQISDASARQLSLTPHGYQLAVNSGNTLFIYAAAQYQHIKGNSQRKAVVLIEFYDAKGDHIVNGYGKLAFSKAFNSHYKYLPCTQGKVSEIYQLKVPANAVRVEVAFQLFNTSANEQVELSAVRIEQLAAARAALPVATAPAFVPPSAQAAAISIAGWPAYPPNGKPYVLGIMDEFTTGCFEQDLNLIQPRPDNWYGLAEKYPPQLFFIESAWKGNMGSWQYRVAQYANKPGQEVAQICQYAKAKGIPTLFWNKEDPVHHDKFMQSARLADYIFTTDANMIPSYREKTGNTKVFALPFAAQPVLHKPAPLKGRKMLSCFAGSWYGDRHAERGQVMGWLLDAANKHGLEIYDRNHGTGIFPFPQQYQHGIKGSLPYKALCDEYNRYRIFLNVNSVTDSPTMFSRRVFELMACGTPVVSTYAKGIEQLFDSDAVWMVNSPQEAEQAIHTLMTDDTEWRRRSLAGIREVFSKHTYAHRLNDIFATLGISSRMPTDPAMLLLAKADTADELRQLQQFAASQQYANFTLAIECSPALSGAAIAARTVLLQPGQGGAWLTQQLAKAKDDSAMLAGHLSAQCRYDVHYLRDLANASLYQPDAAGWAKALGDDCFAFNSPALQAGTLWQAAQFAQQHLHCDPLQPLQQSDLFVADSDQFSLVGQHLGQVVGA
ncbi:glycosyltransferase family protein [Rheinheimera pleomorphica]|uniref:glycosyltransferase family protein n=1 Tax=Rheinheimera pleomorphica TaxID=2703963 RepID=UPI001423FA98|nr:glycosyltransferase [Rheinheimera pleomorphica]